MLTKQFKEIGKMGKLIKGGLSSENSVQAELKGEGGISFGFLYLALRVEKGSRFGGLLELIDARGRKGTISFGAQNSSESVHFASRLVPGRWAVLVVDLKAVLGEAGVLGAQDFELKTVRIHGQVDLKGIYLANVLFDSERLPKSIGFFTPKGKQFGDFFDFLIEPRSSETKTKVEASDVFDEVPEPRARPPAPEDAPEDEIDSEVENNWMGNQGEKVEDSWRKEENHQTESHEDQSEEKNQNESQTDGCSDIKVKISLNSCVWPSTRGVSNIKFVGEGKNECLVFGTGQMVSLMEVN